MTALVEGNQPKRNGKEGWHKRQRYIYCEHLCWRTASEGRPYKDHNQSKKMVGGAWTKEKPQA